MIMRIPNFRGQRAMVLHGRDRNCEAISEQLERLGVRVTVRWPAEAVSAQDADVVFFDSDLGFDELFDWARGQARIPLIAVMGSEAPGRIEWTLAQEPMAYLFKPIGSTGVFTALSIAHHNFSLRQARDQALRGFEQRLLMRGAVLRAAVELMRRHAIDDEQALQLLRAESMRRRLTLEAVSALILDGKWLPAEQPAGKVEPEPGKRRAQSG